MSRVPTAIRQQVRERAGKRCEYCCKPEGVSTYNHQVEHIVSLKHEGASSPDNLAWACFQCNNSKGSDIAAFDKQSGKIVSLFHPRRDQWDDHFEIVGARIAGKTPTGRVAVRLLHMNHPDQVETRAHLLEAGLW